MTKFPTDWFFIKNRDNNYVLSSQKLSTGAPVVISSIKDDDNDFQLWKYDDDGRLSNKMTGFVLDINNETAKAGAEVIQRNPYERSSNQAFNVSPEGYIYLKNSPDLVLGIKDSFFTRTEGLHVHLQTLDTTSKDINQQRWNLVSSSEESFVDLGHPSNALTRSVTGDFSDGSSHDDDSLDDSHENQLNAFPERDFFLKSDTTGQFLGIDINSVNSAGARLTLEALRKANYQSQLWHFDKLTGRLINKHSGFCLSAETFKEDSFLCQSSSFTQKDLSHQSWYFTNAGEVKLKDTAHGHFVLGFKKEGWFNLNREGSPVLLQKPVENKTLSHQKFTVVLPIFRRKTTEIVTVNEQQGVFPDGYFFIKNQKHGLVISVDGTNKLAAQVLASTLDTKSFNRQLWKYENGFLFNKVSNLVLDVRGGCIVSGSEICQYAQKKEGYENQQWELSVEGHIYVKSHKNTVLAISEQKKDGCPIFLANKKTSDHEEQRWNFVLPVIKKPSSVGETPVKTNVTSHQYAQYPSGWFFIRSFVGGSANSIPFVVTADRKTHNIYLTQLDKENWRHQLWTYHHGVLINFASQLAIDLDSTIIGTNICQEPPQNHSISQRFYLSLDGYLVHGSDPSLILIPEIIPNDKTKFRIVLSEYASIKDDRRWGLLSPEVKIENGKQALIRWSVTLLSEWKYSKEQEVQETIVTIANWPEETFFITGQDEMAWAPEKSEVFSSLVLQKLDYSHCEIFKWSFRSGYLVHVLTGLVLHATDDLVGGSQFQLREKLLSSAKDIDQRQKWLIKTNGSIVSESQSNLGITLVQKDNRSFIQLASANETDAHYSWNIVHGHYESRYSDIYKKQVSVLIRTESILLTVRSQQSFGKSDVELLASTTGVFPKNWFYISSRSDKLLVLTAPSNEEGAKLILSKLDFDNFRQQLWRIQDDGCLANLATGYVIDVAGGAMNPGDNIIQWHQKYLKVYRKNQLWALSTDGHIHPQSYPNLVLGAEGGKAAEGSEIQLFTRGSLDLHHQLWSFCVPVFGSKTSGNVENVSVASFLEKGNTTVFIKEVSEFSSSETSTTEIIKRETYKTSIRQDSFNLNIDYVPTGSEKVLRYRSHQQQNFPLTGYFMIKSRLHGYVLDVADSTNGASVILAPIKSTDFASQLWSYKDGHLINVKGYNLVLHASTGAQTRGKLTILAQGASAAEDQTWKLHTSSGLISLNSKRNLSLQVKDTKNIVGFGKSYELCVQESRTTDSTSASPEQDWEILIPSMVPISQNTSDISQSKYTIIESGKISCISSSASAIMAFESLKQTLLHKISSDNQWPSSQTWFFIRAGTENAFLSSGLNDSNEIKFVSLKEKEDHKQFLWMYINGYLLNYKHLKYLTYDVKSKKLYLSKDLGTLGQTFCISTSGGLSVKTKQETTYLNVSSTSKFLGEGRTYQLVASSTEAKSQEGQIQLHIPVFVNFDVEVEAKAALTSALSMLQAISVTNTAAVQKYGIFPSGTWFFVNAVVKNGDGLVLTVKDSSKRHGASLILTKLNFKDCRSQLWTIRDGLLINYGSKLVIDVDGEIKESIRVVQSAESGTSTQKWSLSATGQILLGSYADYGLGCEYFGPLKVDTEVTLVKAVNYTKMIPKRQAITWFFSVPVFKESSTSSTKSTSVSAIEKITSYIESGAVIETVQEKDIQLEDIFIKENIIEFTGRTGARDTESVQSKHEIIATEVRDTTLLTGSKQGTIVVGARDTTLILPKQETITTEIRDTTLIIPKQQTIVTEVRDTTLLTGSKQDTIVTGARDTTLILPKQNIVATEVRDTTLIIPKQEAIVTEVRDTTLLTGSKQDTIVVGARDTTLIRPTQEIVTSEVRDTTLIIPKQTATEINKESVYQASHKAESKMKETSTQEHKQSATGFAKTALMGTAAVAMSAALVSQAAKKLEEHKETKKASEFYKKETKQEASDFKQKKTEHQRTKDIKSKRRSSSDSSGSSSESDSDCDKQTNVQYVDATTLIAKTESADLSSVINQWYEKLIIDVSTRVKVGGVHVTSDIEHIIQTAVESITKTLHAYNARSKTTITDTQLATQYNASLESVKQTIIQSTQEIKTIAMNSSGLRTGGLEQMRTASSSIQEKVSAETRRYNFSKVQETTSTVAVKASGTQVESKSAQTIIQDTRVTTVALFSSLSERIVARLKQGGSNVQEDINKMIESTQQQVNGVFSQAKSTSTTSVEERVEIDKALSSVQKSVQEQITQIKTTTVQATSSSSRLDTSVAISKVLEVTSTSKTMIESSFTSVSETIAASLIAVGQTAQKATATVQGWYSGLSSKVGSMLETKDCTEEEKQKVIVDTKTETVERSSSGRKLGGFGSLTSGIGQRIKTVSGASDTSKVAKSIDYVDATSLIAATQTEDISTAVNQWYEKLIIDVSTRVKSGGAHVALDIDRIILTAVESITKTLHTYSVNTKTTITDTQLATQYNASLESVKQTIIQSTQEIKTIAVNSSGSKTGGLEQMRTVSSSIQEKVTAETRRYNFSKTQETTSTVVEVKSEQSSGTKVETKSAQTIIQDTRVTTVALFSSLSDRIVARLKQGGSNVQEDINKMIESTQQQVNGVFSQAKSTSTTSVEERVEIDKALSSVQKSVQEQITQIKTTTVQATSSSSRLDTSVAISKVLEVTSTSKTMIESSFTSVSETIAASLIAVGQTAQKATATVQGWYSGLSSKVGSMLETKDCTEEEKQKVIVDTKTETVEHSSSGRKLGGFGSLTSGIGQRIKTVSGASDTSKVAKSIDYVDATTLIAATQTEDISTAINQWYEQLIVDVSTRVKSGGAHVSSDIDRIILTAVESITKTLHTYSINSKTAITDTQLATQYNASLESVKQTIIQSTQEIKTIAAKSSGSRTGGLEQMRSISSSIQEKVTAETRRYNFSKVQETTSTVAVKASSTQVESKSAQTIIQDTRVTTVALFSSLSDRIVARLKQGGSNVQEDINKMIESTQQQVNGVFSQAKSTSTTSVEERVEIDKALSSVQKSVQEQITQIKTTTVQATSSSSRLDTSVAISKVLEVTNTSKTMIESSFTSVSETIAASLIAVGQTAQKATATVQGWYSGLSSKVGSMLETKDCTEEEKQKVVVDTKAEIVERSSSSGLKLGGFGSLTSGIGQKIKTVTSVIDTSKSSDDTTIKSTSEEHVKKDTESKHTTETKQTSYRDTFEKGAAGVTALAASAAWAYDHYTKKKQEESTQVTKETSVQDVQIFIDQWYASLTERITACIKTRNTSVEKIVKEAQSELEVYILQVKKTSTISKTSSFESTLNHIKTTAFTQSSQITEIVKQSSSNDITALIAQIDNHVTISKQQTSTALQVHYKNETKEQQQVRHECSMIVQESKAQFNDFLMLLLGDIKKTLDSNSSTIRKDILSRITKSQTEIQIIITHVKRRFTDTRMIGYIDRIKSMIVLQLTVLQEEIHRMDVTEDIQVITERIESIITRTQTRIERTFTEGWGVVFEGKGATFSEKTPASFKQVRFIAFDILDTVTDYRKNITTLLQQKVDSKTFIQEWHTAFIETKRENHYKRHHVPDTIVRQESLEKLLKRYNMHQNKVNTQQLCAAWTNSSVHHDATIGIRRLKNLKYGTVALSDSLSTRSLVDVSQNNCLCWNAQFSADMFEKNTTEAMIKGTIRLLALETPQELAIVSSNQALVNESKKLGCHAILIDRNVTMNAGLEDIKVDGIDVFSETIQLLL